MGVVTQRTQRLEETANLGGRDAGWTHAAVHRCSGGLSGGGEVAAGSGGEQRGARHGEGRGGRGGAVILVRGESDARTAFSLVSWGSCG